MVIIFMLIFFTETTGGACAPEELSNRRFVDAMNGPVWYINATANGHADILDPFFENINEVGDLNQKLKGHLI